MPSFCVLIYMFLKVNCIEFIMLSYAFRLQNWHRISLFSYRAWLESVPFLRNPNNILISAHIHKLNTNGNIYSEVHLWVFVFFLEHLLKQSSIWHENRSIPLYPLKCRREELNLASYDRPSKQCPSLFVTSSNRSPRQRALFLQTSPQNIRIASPLTVLTSSPKTLQAWAGHSEPPSGILPCK